MSQSQWLGTWKIESPQCKKNEERRRIECKSHIAWAEACTRMLSLSMAIPCSSCFNKVPKSNVYSMTPDTLGNVKFRLEPHELLVWPLHYLHLWQTMQLGFSSANSVDKHDTLHCQMFRAFTWVFGSMDPCSLAHGLDLTILLERRFPNYTSNVQRLKCGWTHSLALPKKDDLK